MSGRCVGLGLVSLLVLGIGSTTSAQIPDTTVVLDSLAVPDAPAGQQETDIPPEAQEEVTDVPPEAQEQVTDVPPEADQARDVSREGEEGAEAADQLPPDSLVSPTASPAGAHLSAIPAFTETLSVEEIFGFARSGGAMAYPLNTPGHWVGAHVEHVPLRAMDLTLDGLPFYDVITGGDALALVPADVADRFYRTGAEFGSAFGLSTATRPLRSALPITELRFLIGGSGAQNVSATHAQTRKAPGFLGGEGGRVSGMFHVSNRRGNGNFETERPLRHTDVVARLGLLRPSLGFETQFQYTERQTVGSLQRIPRQTTRIDLRTSIATPIVGSNPTRLSLRWTRQSLSLAAIDTVAAHQFTARFSQPTSRRGALSGWIALDGAFEGDVLAAAARSTMGATLSDTLLFAGNRLGGSVGIAGRAGTWSPVALGRFERGAFFAEASFGLGASTRLADSLNATAEQVGASSVERVARATTGIDLQWQNLRLALGATFSRRSNVTARVFPSDSLIRSVALDEPITLAGGTAEIGFRDQHVRGLYATASGSVLKPLNVEGELAARVAETIPGFRGALRLGVRFLREDTPRIAVDLAATLSGWTQITGQLVDPATGQPAIVFDQQPESIIPEEIPRDGMLDLLADAKILNRAHVFLGLTNTLGGTNRVDILAGQPLPAHQIRFGVSWVLTD